MKIALHDSEKEYLKRKTFPNFALMKISAYHKSIGDTGVLTFNGVNSMDMIIYFVIVVIHLLAYIQSKVIGETDENGKIPKSKKFYELSCTILVLYGTLGYISSRSVFEVAIQWILLIIALALQLLSGYKSLKERKRHKIPKDDDTHRERNTYNENEVN